MLPTCPVQPAKTTTPSIDRRLIAPSRLATLDPGDPAGRTIAEIAPWSARAEQNVCLGGDAGPLLESVPQVSGAALHSLTAVGRIGRYELLGRMATGGMAEIYLARETGPRSASRELVVKRLLPQVATDPQLIEMFINEARLCMRLRHPHICPIYEFGEQDGEYYLAMEWVHGVSLASLARRSRGRGGIPVPFVAKILADVADALHHAHTATDERGHPLGIVHRDVTPENVMLGFDGQVKLLDWGIAKAKTQLDKTQYGVLKGKFAYMSPEQYQGAELDGRADIFSLGVCLYELVTGKPLYARDSEYETVAAIVLDEATPSIRDVDPELPEDLDAIAQKALAKSRAERFRTAEDMQHALESFLVNGRHVVRDSHVAGMLKNLFAQELREGPDLDRTPPSFGKGSSAPGLSEAERAELHAHLDEVEGALASAGRRKKLAVGLVAALVVVVTAAVVSMFALRGQPAAADPSEAPVEESAAPR